MCQSVARMVSTAHSELLLRLLAEAVSTVTKTPDGKNNNAQSISTAPVDHLSPSHVKISTLARVDPRPSSSVKTVNMLIPNPQDLEE